MQSQSQMVKVEVTGTSVADLELTTDIQASPAFVHMSLVHIIRKLAYTLAEESKLPMHDCLRVAWAHVKTGVTDGETPITVTPKGKTKVPKLKKTK